MSDPTQIQGRDSQSRSQQLSLQRTQPPIEVPGYQTQRLLGTGAYGEVWVALDRNTGRQVAIKFYTHRSGLDWSLLSREVEKLVFLSTDRYVVQLLEVGWDAEPPYYVMEYIEQGSLDDRLRDRGTLALEDAVPLFRDIATGLLHAHGRGVLHCDIKPANILLDVDGKPRLADFGQSRLSSEQTPALGTLFYMAPEQADLKSLPDARWDVYALGAVFYAMLTGKPPYQSEEAITAIQSARDLDQRLLRYRQYLQTADPPTEHRNVPGMDAALGDIVDRCLETDPKERFPNVQSVIDALNEREARRARKPLMILGVLGPALLLMVMSLAAMGWLNTAIGKSDTALTERALESNRFAAQYVAKAAANELERRFRSVEQLARDDEFQDLVAETLDDESLAELREVLNDPAVPEDEFNAAREKYLDHPAQQKLQAFMDRLFAETGHQLLASWFVNDRKGLQLARGPQSDTIGRNYGWRTYFHGGPADMPRDWRPGPNDHVQQTRLSAVFRSQATGRYIAGISTPVYAEDDDVFLGVAALTVELGEFVELEGNAGQLAVLVDWRDGYDKGLILQHPLFEAILDREPKLPDRFADYRLDVATFPDERLRKVAYRDPLAEDKLGTEYRGSWLAETAPVELRDRKSGDIEKSGLVIVVQEKHQHAIGPVLTELKQSLVLIGGLAMVVIVAILAGLWALAVRVVGKRALGSPDAVSSLATPGTPRTPADMPTVQQRRS